MDEIQIHFYGGHADGTARDVPLGTASYEYPTAPGMRHARKQPFTRYLHSNTWSQHFDRTTFVPEGFPGKPPHREKVA